MTNNNIVKSFSKAIFTLIAIGWFFTPFVGQLFMIEEELYPKQNTNDFVFMTWVTLHTLLHVAIIFLVMS